MCRNKKSKKNNLKVGAAVGTSEKELIRARQLIDSGVDMLVIDTAHGHSKNVLKILEKIKKFSKNLTLCAGNIATAEAAKLLYNQVRYLKVGIGPDQYALQEWLQELVSLKKQY